VFTVHWAARARWQVKITPRAKDAASSNSQSFSRKIGQILAAVLVQKDVNRDMV
jgi:hypothetical protein